MAILWMGCQPDDLFINGAYSVSTGGSYHDITYSIGAVNPNGYPYQYGSAANSRFIAQNFSQPSSDFWFSFRMTTDIFSSSIGGYGEMAAPGRPWLWFTDATMTTPLKMRFAVTYAHDDRKFYVRVYDDAGVATTITSRDTSVAPPVIVSGLNPARFDIHLRLGKADGIFRLYQSGVLLVDFTGDTLGPLSSARVDGWAMGSSGYYSPSISEVFAIERDSRSLRLKAQSMSALDPANEWSGVVANLNEFNPDITTLMSATAADQVLDATVSDLPNTSMYPYGMKLVVRAAKADDGGPAAIQIGVKSGGTSDYSADIPLTTAYQTYTRSMTMNPVTGQFWTAAEVNAMNLLIKSKA